MVTHCGKDHELEWESWEIVVQEQHTSEKEVRQEMSQPANQKDTP